jgi:hypothetical protein
VLSIDNVVVFNLYLTTWAKSDDSSDSTKTLFLQDGILTSSSPHTVAFFSSAYSPTIACCFISTLEETTKYSGSSAGLVGGVERALPMAKEKWKIDV